MTTLEFIASLAGSLAWPSVAALAVWQLRAPLGDALRRGGRVSAMGVDVELGRAEEALGEQARELVADNARDLPLQTDDEQLLAAVEQRSQMLPIVAVREGYDKLRKRLHGAAGVDDDRRRSVGAIASHLKDQGLLPVESMPAIEAIEVIKSLADRDTGSGLAINEERAAEFIGYMRIVLAKIRSRDAATP